MLYTLETFAEFAQSDEVLIGYSQTFIAYFEKYMSDQDFEVKIEAASSFTNFLSYMNDEKNIMKYQGAFPTLIKLLIEAVKDNEERGLKMVNSIDHLVKSHPKFVKNQLEELLNVFTEMAGATPLCVSLRNAALMAILSIATTQAQYVKKSKTFVEKTLLVTMNIVAEQPDDITEWLASRDEHELSSNSVSATAVENFAGFTTELGSKFMLQRMIKDAFKYIVSDNWKMQYAGLMSLGMMFEECKDHFEDELGNFINLLAPTLTSSNPKVQYASMHCIALLCTEFTPELQTEHHAAILPIVINIMMTNEHQKLKLQACSMMINFFRELLEFDEEDRAFIPIYSDQIMSNLIKLFELGLSSNNMPIIEEVLSLISILAALMTTGFAKYYPHLFPGMINLLKTTTNDTDAKNRMRTVAISSIGYMMASFQANPQEIKSDIIGVLEYLIDLKKNISSDDSQNKAILEVYEVLLGSLGKEFLPFVPVVLEHTLQCANKDINFVVEDDLTGAGGIKEGGKRDKGAQSMAIDLKVLGGKKILTLNHNTLEQKVIAFDLLKSLAKFLKKDLRPHLESIVEVMFQYLDYKFSDGIRQFCYKSLNHLLGVCSDESEMSKIFEMMGPKILDNAIAFLKIGNDEKSYSILKHFKKAAENFTTPCFSEPLMAKWISAMELALAVCQQRKAEIIKEVGDLKALDEEQREDFEADYAVPNMLMHVVMDTSSLWLKLYKEKIESVIVNNFGTYFYHKSTDYVVEDEVHYSTCFYGELFNNCSEAKVAEGYNVVLGIVFGPIENTSDCNFQQTGAFLLGVRNDLL